MAERAGILRRVCSVAGPGFLRGKRAAIYAATLLVLLAVLAWYVRLIYLEGYLYRIPGSFSGDFQATLKGAWAPWDGHTLFYGPVFMLEWRYLWLPGHVSMLDFEHVDLVLFAGAFLACWRAIFPGRGLLLFLGILVLWLAHGASLDLIAEGAHLELIELLCICVALLCAVRTWRVQEGAALGLAVATKTLPGFFLPYLALRRQWRALGAALVVSGALLLIVCAVQGISPVEGVRDLVFQAGNLTKVHDSEYEMSVRDDIARTLAGGMDVDVSAAQEQSAILLSAGLAAVVTVIAGWVVWRRPRREQEGVLFGLVATVMLIATPSAHSFYFAFLFPGWTAIVATLLRRRTSGSTVLLWAAFLFSYTFTGFDTPFLVTQKLFGVGVGFVQDWAQLHLYSFGLLANLLVCFALLLAKERPGEAPRQSAASGLATSALPPRLA